MLFSESVVFRLATLVDLRFLTGFPFPVFYYKRQRKLLKFASVHLLLTKRQCLLQAFINVSFFCYFWFSSFYSLTLSLEFCSRVCCTFYILNEVFQKVLKYFNVVCYRWPRTFTLSSSSEWWAPPTSPVMASAPSSTSRLPASVSAGLPNVGRPTLTTWTATTAPTSAASTAAPTSATYQVFQMCFQFSKQNLT